MKASNINQMIEVLEKRGIIPTEIPSLTPIKDALIKSGLINKIDSKKTIVVAGTNGKGSTCATLSALLFNQGREVGMYTSPHLVRLNERFRINEKDVTNQELLESYNTLTPIIESENLSHFESLTLMAAWLFHSGVTRSPIEYAIYEVGMGGLWDASNAIPHQLCAITPIGLDHQFFLGETLAQIAEQKLGIINPNSQVLFVPPEKELIKLAEIFCTQKKATLNFLPDYNFKAPNTLLSPWGTANMSLWGERAAQNSMTALKLFELLGFSADKGIESLNKVNWPGRFQEVSWPQLKCPLFLSGDHNTQGLDSLMKILKRLKWKTLHLVVGIGVDKDASTILETLSNLPSIKLYLTETTLKPLKIESYPEKWKRQATESSANVEVLLNTIAQEATEEDLVLVTGSLYLVGKVLELIEHENHLQKH